MKNRNFIIARLCDNDFGGDLKRALDFVVDQHDIDNMDDVRLKATVIEHVVCSNQVRDVALGRETVASAIVHAASLRTYLHTADIRFSQKNDYEGFDDDGGSAIFDLNQTLSWTF